MITRTMTIAATATEATLPARATGEAANDMAAAAPPPRSDHALLQLIWLASPALPVGGFSYSEGLEAGVEWSGVQSEAAAADWLVHQLHLSLVRGDLAVLAQAIPAWTARDLPRVQALNDWVFATRESAEFRLQTEQMGHSFLEWIKLHHADAAALLGDLLPASYPIAYAFAAARSGAGARDGCLAFAFGWAENMVAAAVKAVPLGQSAGQRMLARLAREIPVAVDAALALDDEGRQAFCPMLAILSARHETQYSRLFRS